MAYSLLRIISPRECSKTVILKSVSESHVGLVWAFPGIWFRAGRIISVSDIFPGNADAPGARTTALGNAG